MERLGLDLQSAFGMPPLEYVAFAADIGCGHVTTGLAPVPWNPCNFPAWSLRDDAALRNDLKALMRDRGVRLSVASGFSLRPGTNVRDYAADMDLAADLGALQIGTVGMDPDIARAHDQLAALTEMAADRGMETVLDYAPHHPINTLPLALAAIRHTGSPRARLSIDAMHFFRSGGGLHELKGLDPALIGYAQVCDVALAAPHGDYGREATFERLSPGDGELPLAAFVAALPQDVLIGVETPNLAAAEAGRLRDFITRAVTASEHLLNSAAR